MPLYLQSISVLLVSIICSVHIHASAVKAMLAGDVLPECGTYLVALCKLSIHIVTSLAADHHIRIGRFEGEPVHMIDISILFLQRKLDHGRGAAPHAPGAILCRWKSTHDFPHAWNFGGVIMAYAGFCWMGLEWGFVNSGSLLLWSRVGGRGCSGEADAFWMWARAGKQAARASHRAFPVSAAAAWRGRSQSQCRSAKWMNFT